MINLHTQSLYAPYDDPRSPRRYTDCTHHLQWISVADDFSSPSFAQPYGLASDETNLF